MAAQHHDLIKRSLRSSAVILLASAAIAGPASAQQASSSESLAKEVVTLRLEVHRQAERIRTLEEALTRLGGTDGEEMFATGPAADLPATWTVPQSWDRLKRGMSESSVVDVLGSPSRIVRSAVYRMLHYEGEVAGRVLSGSVKIVDEDWVEEITRPDF